MGKLLISPIDLPSAVDIPKSLFSLLQVSLSNLGLLAPLLAAYVPVVLFAVGFVALNGGIVLGTYFIGVFFPEADY